MRKLLSLMGSLGLLTTSAVGSTTSVVSCGIKIQPIDQYLNLWMGLENFNPGDGNTLLPNKDAIIPKYSFYADALGFISQKGLDHFKESKTITDVRNLLLQDDPTADTDAIIKGAATFFNAARGYAGLDTSSLANLANASIYNNAMMLHYFIMTCKADKLNFDTKKGKEIDSALETFKYQVFKSDDTALSKSFSIICKTDHGEHQPGSAVIGEDGTLSMDGASYITVTHGNEVEKIQLVAEATA